MKELLLAPLELTPSDRAAHIEWDPVEVKRPNDGAYNLSQIFFPGIDEDLGIPQLPGAGWSGEWETVSRAIKPVDLREGTPVVLLRPEKPSDVNFSLLTADGRASEISAVGVNHVYLRPDSDTHLQINGDDLFLRGYLRADPDHSGITVNFGGQFDHSRSRRGSHIYTMWGGGHVDVNHRSPLAVLGEGDRRIRVSYLQHGVRRGASERAEKTIFQRIA